MRPLSIPIALPEQPPGCDFGVDGHSQSAAGAIAGEGVGRARADDAVDGARVEAEHRQAAVGFDDVARGAG